MITSQDVVKTKILKVGNQIEVSRFLVREYRADQGRLLTTTDGAARRKKYETTDSEKIKNMITNAKRKRTKIRRLSLCNAEYTEQRRPKFLTLTHADIPTLEESARRLDVFFKRLKRRIPYLKYITSLELQRRGSPHYHIILFNAPYLSIKLIQSLWTWGYIDISAIRSQRGIQYYISKYISKTEDADGQLLIDIRLYGARTLSYSRNLALPVSLLPDYINLNGLKLVYFSREHDFRIFTFTDEDQHVYEFNLYSDKDGAEFIQIPLI